MNKVKIPKEVAEAIEEANENYKYAHSPITKYGVFSWVTTSTGDIAVNARMALNQKYSREAYCVLMEALVNGYEVELSKEDKVREWVKEQNKMMNGSAGKAYDWQLDGALHILKLLNIKIEGVNT